MIIELPLPLWPGRSSLRLWETLPWLAPLSGQSGQTCSMCRTGRGTGLHLNFSTARLEERLKVEIWRQWVLSRIVELSGIVKVSWIVELFGTVETPSEKTMRSEERQ